MPASKILSYLLDIEKREQVLNVPRDSQCLSVTLAGKGIYISFLTTIRGSVDLPYEKVKVMIFQEGDRYMINNFTEDNHYVGVYVRGAYIFHVFTTAPVWK